MPVRPWGQNTPLTGVPEVLTQHVERSNVAENQGKDKRDYFLSLGRFILNVEAVYLPKRADKILTEPNGVCPHRTQLGHVSWPGS